MRDVSRDRQNTPCPASSYYTALDAVHYAVSVRGHYTDVALYHEADDRYRAMLFAYYSFKTYLLYSVRLIVLYTMQMERTWDFFWRFMYILYRLKEPVNAFVHILMCCSCIMLNILKKKLFFKIGIKYVEIHFITINFDYDLRIAIKRVTVHYFFFLFGPATT
jgi:hypothetical protein